MSMYEFPTSRSWIVVRLIKVGYGHLAVDPEPEPVQAIAVYRNGDNWRLATVLHRTHGDDIELLDPWVEQLSYAGGALKDEWRYLTGRQHARRGVPSGGVQ